MVSPISTIWRVGDEITTLIVGGLGSIIGDSVDGRARVINSFSGGKKI